MAIASDPQSPLSIEHGRRHDSGRLTAERRRLDAPPTGRRRGAPRAGAAQLELNEPERRLLGDLFAIVSEHAADSAVEIDRERVQDAFVFACEHHAAQRRKSGEDFIVHPVGVARICAGMRLDTETLCAALLHDTVEDTSRLDRGGARALRRGDRRRSSTA